MAVEVLMPKMGLTMTEGIVGEWKKKEGESVKKEKFSLRLKQISWSTMWKRMWTACC